MALKRFLLGLRCAASDTQRLLTDPCERALRQFLARGHTTHREILTAAAGAWPLSGLDIDDNAIPSAPIEVVRDPFPFTHGGRSNDSAFVNSLEPDILRLNPASRMRPLSFSSVVHESTHCLQFRDDPFLEIIDAKHVRSLLRGAQTPSWVFYAAKDIEVQARLAQILLQGYRTWQRMPSDRLELWAALAGFGVRLHREAEMQLLETKEGMETLRAFAFPLIRDKDRRGASAHAGAGLARIAETARAAGTLRVLHEVAVPLLYGHLIEGWGDRLGRARMNLPSMTAARQAFTIARAGNLEDAMTAWTALESEPRRISFKAIWREMRTSIETVESDADARRRRLDGVLETMAGALGPAEFLRALTTAVENRALDNDLETAARDRALFAPFVMRACPDALRASRCAPQPEAPTDDEPDAMPGLA